MDDAAIYKLELDGRILGKFGKAGKLPKEFGLVNAIDCRTENVLLRRRVVELARPEADASRKVSLSDAPVVTEMRVVPVAGHDSMLLNLSGAHGPFFTRNLVILTDTHGHNGVGEVPGGERIARRSWNRGRSWSASSIGAYRKGVQRGAARIRRRDAGAAAGRRSICASRSTR